MLAIQETKKKENMLAIQETKKKENVKEVVQVEVKRKESQQIIHSLDAYKCFGAFFLGKNIDIKT